VRASRLLAILLLLQTRGRMTAAELASEVEVSVRTVYRDLQALSAAGVPVYAEAGPGGGARLVDGYRTRLDGLNASEAEALFLAGMPGPAAELGLGTVLAAAQLKVLSALPPELRGRATRVAERFHLDAPDWFRRTDAVPHLPLLAEALWSDRRARVHYSTGFGDGERVVERRVEPLGLVLKAGVWYLVARVGGAIRTYRVGRVRDAELLDESFERPADFDLAAYWATSAESFAESMLRLSVLARVAPCAEPLLRHALPTPAGQWALESLGPPEEDGWRPLVIRCESVPIAHDELLRLGDRIEVLEPIELREQLAATARAMAARYSGVRVTSGP